MIGTSHLEHADSLDGWRGLAITALLVGHFAPVPGINFGTIGVNMFFVLSGLLMSRILFIKKTPIPVFYRRRISRVVPAHFVFILTVSLAFTALDLDVSTQELLAALFFVNNYVGPEAGPGTATMPFGHVWSLAVEEHTYVLLSLVAILGRRNHLSTIALCVAMVLACIAFSVLYYEWNPPNLQFTWWLHTETAAFGILVSAALAQREVRLPRMIPAGVAVIGLVGVGMLVHWWSIPLVVQRVIGVGCLAFAVNLLPSASTVLTRAISWRPLRLMGLWSFSLYLWQQPFYLLMHEGRLSMSSAFGLAFLFGLSSYYLVENPVRSYLNRVWAAERSPLP